MSGPTHCAGCGASTPQRDSFEFLLWGALDYSGDRMACPRCLLSLTADGGPTHPERPDWVDDVEAVDREFQAIVAHLVD